MFHAIDYAQFGSISLSLTSKSKFWSDPLTISGSLVVKLSIVVADAVQFGFCKSKCIKPFTIVSGTR